MKLFLAWSAASALVYIALSQDTVAYNGAAYLTFAGPQAIGLSLDRVTPAGRQGGGVGEHPVVASGDAAVGGQGEGPGSLDVGQAGVGRRGRGAGAGGCQQRQGEE